LSHNKLDQYGRATWGEAILTAPLTSGPEVNAKVKVPGFVRGVHDKSHLIGQQFGGSGGRKNLVPLLSNVNQVVMYAYEKQIKQAVDNGDTVQYRVTPIYEGSNPVPKAITLEAKGGTIDISVSILNR
jgi:DNA-entry nuclease